MYRTEKHSILFYLDEIINFSLEDKDVVLCHAGTAEKDGQEDNALFCGFAPLDSPEIVVTCVIEEGQHGYYASEVVAKTMAAYFKDKSNQKTE